MSKKVIYSRKPFLKMQTQLRAFVIILLFGFSNNLKSQIVPINDIVFKEYLLLNGYDTSLDGEIDSTEAAVVTYIDVSYLGVTNLYGIGAFTSLVTLKASGNSIDDSVDVSNNLSLEILDLKYNSISELDITNLSNLEYLNLESCNLDTLDISQNVNLKHLNLNYNHIQDMTVTNHLNLTRLEVTSNDLTELNIQSNFLLDTLVCNYIEIDTLDISFNPLLRKIWCKYSNIQFIKHSGLDSLRIFDCVGNNLTFLDVTSASKLKDFDCVFNELSELYVSGLTDLYSMNCDHNLLTTLDVSGCTNLYHLNCENNLMHTINFSNNDNLHYLYLSNNYFTTIGDLSGVPNLQQFTAYNNLYESISVVHPTLTNLYLGDNPFLITLDICQSSNIDNLQLNFMPQIIKVNVWTLPFPPTGSVVGQINSPNVYYALGNCPLETPDLSSQTKLTTFPNPCFNYININIESPFIGDNKIELFDMLGQRILVLTSSEKSFDLDVSNLLSGNYILKVSNENSEETRLISKL